MCHCTLRLVLLSERVLIPNLSYCDGQRIARLSQRLQFVLQMWKCPSLPSALEGLRPSWRHTQTDFWVAPQLPRTAQPIIPLVYGWPFYVEFLFAWQEHGNGEACRLGVQSCNGRSSRSSTMSSASSLGQLSPS